MCDVIWLGRENYGGGYRCCHTVGVWYHMAWARIFWWSFWMTSYGLDDNILVDFLDDIIQLACDVIQLGGKELWWYGLGYGYLANGYGDTVKHYDDTGLGLMDDVAWSWVASYSLKLNYEVLENWHAWRLRNALWIQRKTEIHIDLHTKVVPIATIIPYNVVVKAL